MARVTHAMQIDLRFGDPAREFSDFSVGFRSGDFAREQFHLFAQDWIRTNGQAQPVAKRVSRQASAAPARFSGRCWPVRFCGLPRSCVCWSRQALRFG